MKEDDLDRMLRAARTDEVPIPDRLRARILADAPVARRRSIWRPDLPAIGAMIGLPGAAALGLVLGLAQPALIVEPLAVVVPVDMADPIGTVFGTFTHEAVE